MKEIIELFLGLQHRSDSSGILFCPDKAKKI